MSEATKTYIRFRVLERIEHFVLVISFSLLGITGLPQKYPLNSVSDFVIRLFGGIEATRIIHHISAAVFLVEAVYHIVIVGYKLYIERKKATMVPTIKDGQDAMQWFGYNLGFTKKMPKMPRYNFMEKAEYWAMLWGLLVMGLTGLMLWNPIATTNVLPGDFVPAAKAAHGGEAVLAVLAIILWHFYNVHIKHWNWGMIKGTITHHEMEEEHAAELDEMAAGPTFTPPSPEEKRRRLNVFIPSAAVVSVVLVGIVYFFLTFEKTAITTVPPAMADVKVYVLATATPSPIPLPTNTPEPTKIPDPTKEGSVVAGESVVVWKGQIETLLKDKCVSCHGSMGGFSAETYDNVMKVVTAGDPAASKIVEVQKKGGHPGQLSDAEIQQVVDWIKGGAVQEGGAGSSGAGSSGVTSSGGAAAETWSTGIETLFKDKCSACHGTMGGFTATSYDDLVKAITPGDADASKIVEVQKKGGHPGQFSDDELTRVINWIKANAPK